MFAPADVEYSPRDSCRPLDAPCRRLERLRDWRGGGCVNISGAHVLLEPLLLRCPARLEGNGDALVSGGAELRVASVDRGSCVFELAPPWPGRQLRQLFVRSGGRHGDRLHRLNISSADAKPFRFTSTPEGFDTIAAGACDTLTRMYNESAYLEVVYVGMAWNEPRCRIASIPQRVLSNTGEYYCKVPMAQPCHYRVCRKWEGRNCGSDAQNPGGGALQAVRIENVLPAAVPRPARASSAHWVQRENGRVLAFVGASSCTSARLSSPPRFYTPVADGLLFSATDLTVRGVRFVLSGWSAPALADGYAETQATLHLRGTRDKESIQLGKRICPPAAAVVVGGRARVEGCIFEACGGAGVAIRDGIVTNSTFSDLSAGAILLGSPALLRPPVAAAARCNAIRRVGAEYAGSLGIWAGYLWGGAVEANVLEELPYSGISMGWGWATWPHCSRNFLKHGACSTAGGNNVTENLVRRVVLRGLDGGAVYTLGPQLGSRIARNLALVWPGQPVDVPCDLTDRTRPGLCTGRYAIYLDSGSAGFAIADNVVGEGARLFIKGRAHTLTRLRALRCGNESARPGARGLRLGPAPAWCELALSDEVEKPRRTRRAPSPQEGCSPADGAECASLVQGECSASLNPAFRLPREPPLRNTSRYRAWARAAAAIAPASGTECARDAARAVARFREQLASARCGGMLGAPPWQGATLT